jgi:hypothetical protein
LEKIAGIMSKRFESRPESLAIKTSDMTLAVDAARVFQNLSHLGFVLLPCFPRFHGMQLSKDWPKVKSRIVKKL